MRTDEDRRNQRVWKLRKWSDEELQRALKVAKRRVQDIEAVIKEREK